MYVMLLEAPNLIIKYVLIYCTLYKANILTQSEKHIFNVCRKLNFQVPSKEDINEMRCYMNIFCIIIANKQKTALKLKQIFCVFYTYCKR